MFGSIFIVGVNDLTERQAKATYRKRGRETWSRLGSSRLVGRCSWDFMNNAHKRQRGKWGWYRKGGYKNVRI